MASNTSWSREGAINITNGFGNQTSNFTSHLLFSTGPSDAMVPVIVVSFFHSLTCAVGTIGNLLVIIVLLRFSNMKAVPNIYILNLAMADFLFMLSVPFFLYQYITMSWVFSQAMCKVILAIDGMNMFTGVFLLTAMSIDRYLALVHPLKSRVWRSVRSARVVCVLMWGISATLCLPLWLYAEVERKRSVLCIVNFPKNVENTFILISFINGYALPLLIIAVCYVRIACRVTTVSSPAGQAILSRTPGTGAARNDPHAKRVAVLVVAAIVAFAVCWLPFYAMQLYTTFASMSENVGPTIAIMYYVSIWLSYTNSAINPFIYSLVGKSFRQNVVRVICCQKDHIRLRSDMTSPITSRMRPYRR